MLVPAHLVPKIMEKVRNHRSGVHAKRLRAIIEAAKIRSQAEEPGILLPLTVPNDGFPVLGFLNEIVCALEDHAIMDVLDKALTLELDT
jgi:hypothetical protein